MAESLERKSHQIPCVYIKMFDYRCSKVWGVGTFCKEGITEIEEDV